MLNARVIASDLAFPEGPVALGDGSVILVEIRGGRLTRIFPDGRKHVIAAIPGGPNGAALGPDGKVWVCNNGGFSWLPNGGIGPLQQADYVGGAVQRVDIQTGEVETVFDGLNGPNDLVFDRAGNVWFTDLGKRYQRHIDLGFVYFGARGATQPREVASLFTPNGVGLTPDENRLYVSESMTARVWAFDLAGPGGELKPDPAALRGEKGRCIAGLGGYQLFDLLAVEASGNICVATILNGGISVISPDGALVQHVPTGDPFTTNICFGGPDLRTAYVTLSHLGQLIAMDWPRPGLALNFRT